MTTIMIDVREKDEFDAEHVENSIHIPLSSFDRQAPAILRGLQDRKVIFMCRSGNRAKLAIEQARAFAPDGMSLEAYEGGILKWKALGQPVVILGRSRLPIIRQVMLTAGLLVLTGVILTLTVNPGFIWLSGFVGAGLTFAGATGFCPMAELLSRMPWNKSSPGIKKELCATSPSGGSCSDAG